MDFPRDWDLIVPLTVSAVASITVPAIPGVAHVLTAVNAAIVNNAAHAGIALLVTANGLYLPSLVLAVPGVSAVESASGAWTGTLATAPGGALTVALNGSQANLYEFLELQGYDY